VDQADGAIDNAAVDEHDAMMARRAASFGTAATAYAEHRPDYPAAALEWGLAPVRGVSGLRVLDLGAGTGKLTGGLRALGVDVVAVEPDAAMLRELSRRYPEVTAKIGPAEAIPLPDDCVDAVFVGQALHWFDLDRTWPQISRVLRPGGVLVVIWNVNDDRVPWVAGFCELSDTVRYTQLRDGWAAVDEFGPNEHTEFPHRQRRTADSLTETVATQSNVLISEPAHRAAILAEVRAYLANQPATARGEFDLPIVTTVVRARPR
jgi:SAM-dependent methyltransferase